MAHRSRHTSRAIVIVVSMLVSAGHAQQRSRDGFGSLGVRLARLEAQVGSATDARSLARAHRELLSLREAVAREDRVAARDVRTRLARLSERLRNLSQQGTATVPVTAAAGTGIISGVVTADGGTPLADVVVNVFRLDDGMVTTTTDSAGGYQVEGLDAGDYKVFTYNRLGFIDEIYKDTPCALGACSFYSQGTTVVVTDGATIGGIDFVLSPGGRIAGRVTDAATGAPIAGAEVGIATEDFAFTTGMTDADGRYVSETGLSTGTYRARVSRTGYLSELFDDVQCSAHNGCEFSFGTPIAVVAGVVTGGVDFALDKGGTISGRVTASDTGNGLPGVNVYIVDSATSEVVSQAYTEADGRYQSFDGLVTGTYWLRVFAGATGYLDEAYDNILADHRTFIPLGVTAVPVTVGQETGGIDFVLDRGAVLTGRVTDSSTGQPLRDRVVEAITTTRFPFFNDFGVTDESGVYRIQALGTGTYRAFVEGDNGYLGEVWRELECYGNDCYTIPATPIEVQAGDTVAGIDFTPIKGGWITGSVVDHQTNTPLADVEIRVYDSDGNYAFVAPVPTNADGGYTIDGLPTGFFFLVAQEGDFLTNTYVDELYGGTPCPALECDVTRARPVRVSAGSETSGVDFRLDQGGKISGRVTDALTGAPLSFATVDVYDPVTGRFLGYTWTDESGQYTSREALPRGQYLVVADLPGYRPEIYDDVACAVEGCYLTFGRRVRVTPPAVTTGIDFALTPLSTSTLLRVSPR